MALAVELVATDSVNPGLVPGAAGERSLVDLLAARLGSAGFVTTEVAADLPGDRPSLVAAAPPLPGAPTVVLCGHLDTVGVSGMDSPFEGRVEDDRLHGRGAADMKGGVAALVVAAEHLLASGARLRPVLALVADEEDANAGSEAVVAALPGLGVDPDVCLIAEPTGLELARSLRGFAVAEVTLPGRAAHSSQPAEGVNAVSRLATFVTAVDHRAAAVRARGGDLMVTVARGGSSPFVVPDEATAVVERRTVPGEEADLVAEVRGLVDPAWQAEVRLLADRPAWRQADDGPAGRLAEALGARLGTGATFEAPYWMEAPLWEQLCPTVICGPAGGGLHAVDEWVDLRQVRALAEALVEVLGHGCDTLGAPRLP